MATLPDIRPHSKPHPYSTTMVTRRSIPMPKITHYPEARLANGHGPHDHRGSASLSPSRLDRRPQGRGRLRRGVRAELSAVPRTAAHP